MSRVLYLPAQVGLYLLIAFIGMFMLRRRILTNQNSFRLDALVRMCVTRLLRQAAD